MPGKKSFLFGNGVFGKRPKNLYPRLSWGRTHLLRVTEDIAEGMEKVYCLRIKKNPETLISPKEQYAKEVRYDKAILLNSNRS